MAAAVQKAQNASHPDEQVEVEHPDEQPSEQRVQLLSLQPELQLSPEHPVLHVVHPNQQLNGIILPDFGRFLILRPALLILVFNSLVFIFPPNYLQ